MIWVILWAAALVAFIAYFFRGHWRWFFFWILGLIAIIASAFVQEALTHRPG